MTPQPLARASTTPLARWSQDSFYFQHWTALKLRVFCDLYDGDLSRTERMLDDGIARAKDARLFDNHIVRAESLQLRASVTSAPQPLEALTKEKRAWTDALALLIHADSVNDLHRAARAASMRHGAPRTRRATRHRRRRVPAH